MSEILTLAETFKQKSNKHAELIEEELDSVMQRLNESMTAKLEESENIIKNGTANLSAQNERLQLTLNTHQDDTDTAITSYTEGMERLTEQGLQRHTEKIQSMIQGYTVAMETALEEHTIAIDTTIEQTQSTVYQAIKSDMNKWAIIAGVAMFMILILGLLMGIGIAKKVVDPTVIYYQEQPKNQPYNP